MTDLGSPTGEIEQFESPGHREVGRLAARQHRIVAHWQLIAMGFGVEWVQHQLRSGLLYRLFRGVYAVGCSSVSGLGRILAAVLACGPDAVASHQTAALLHGILRTSRSLIDVTTSRSRHGHR